MRVKAWRIVKKSHAKNAFSGDGAKIYGGRWNPVGIPVIYAAESLALAALEIVVHLGNEALLFQHFVKISITFPSKMIITLDRTELPPDWRHLPPPESTQQVGLDWASKRSSAVLKVPSSIISEENNYVINPEHPDFSRIEMATPKEFSFDARLIEK